MRLSDYTYQTGPAEARFREYIALLSRELYVTSLEVGVAMCSRVCGKGPSYAE
jgi:hypothetical protein